MAIPFRSQCMIDDSGDAVVASVGSKLLETIVSPFRIVLAMRPQREREAAQIVREFGSNSWSDALDRKLTEKVYRNRTL